MTEELFRRDAYQTECEARVLRVQAEGVVLDRTVFYPLGGGQAGDAGWLLRANGENLEVVDTRKAKDAEGRPTGDILHVVSPADAQGLALLAPGDVITARIDWPRRHRLMRFHTATHLLCHLVARPVNGCSITPDYARLDFHMTEPLDKDSLTQGLAALVAAAHPLAIGAISDAELDAQPELVRSMSVQPPRGTGSVRTIRIGEGEVAIDFQPCGGTHVRSTAEIGDLRVSKIEKKSANSRRVVLGWAE